MKVSIKIEKEYDIQLMQICAEVRYWDDGEVNGKPCSEDGKELPFVQDGCWRPLIEIESGKIRNWEKGKTADLHFKICDRCAWSVMDSEMNTIYFHDWNYVPDILSTGGDGYGDYIIMKIDESGLIENWNKNLIEKEFESEED